MQKGTNSHHRQGTWKGTKKKAGLPVSSGAEGILTNDDDIWYGPYVFRSAEERNRRFDEYLNWELGLIDQLERDGSNISSLHGSLASQQQ